MQAKSTVLITGASAGIGWALAERFAKAGHDLVLVARNLERLQALKNQLEKNHNLTVSVFQCDLTQKSQIQDFLDQVADLKIDIVINNAGFGDYGLFTGLELAKQLELIDLNISALVYLTHHFAKKFTEEKPGSTKKILNVASVAGFTAGPLMASYFASKAFVVSFSKALACELKPFGVQVSCLCPGPTHSEFAKRAGVDNKLAFNFGMSATAVADITYKKLMQGKTIIITGLQNKLLVMLMKILPYQLLTWINKKILEF
jgi:short-subunit dehydrogenase